MDINLFEKKGESLCLVYNLKDRLHSQVFCTFATIIELRCREERIINTMRETVAVSAIIIIALSACMTLITNAWH